MTARSSNRSVYIPEVERQTQITDQALEQLYDDLEAVLTAERPHDAERLLEHAAGYDTACGAHAMGRNVAAGWLRWCIRHPWRIAADEHPTAQCPCGDSGLVSYDDGLTFQPCIRCNGDTHEAWMSSWAKRKKQRRPETPAEARDDDDRRIRKDLA